MVQSFPYLVLLYHDAVAGRHDQLARVVEPEIGLHDLAVALGNQVSAVSFDCLAQVPDDCVLSKTADDEALNAALALVELGGQEAEVLNAESLQVQEGNFQLDGSRSVIEADLLIKEGDFIVVFSWDEPEIPSERGKHPFSVLGGVEVNDWIASRGELVVGVLSNLLEEPDLTILGASHKRAAAGCIDGRELRIASVFFETADAFLRPRVNFVNGVLCDCLEGLEGRNVCHLVLRTNADNALLWTGILNVMIVTYSSTNLDLMRSW